MNWYQLMQAPLILDLPAMERGCRGVTGKLIPGHGYGLSLRS